MLPSVGELKVPIYKSTIDPVFSVRNGSPGPNFLNPAAGELTYELWFCGIVQALSGKPHWTFRCCASSMSLSMMLLDLDL